MSSIRTVLDVDFLERLNALGKGDQRTGAALAKAARGGEAAESRVRKGLRSGAQFYAKALNGINYAGSLVNFARQDLEALQKLTTSMVGLAEEASKEGTGTQRRRALDRQFFSLAKEFVQIQRDAEVNDRRYLTRDGLTETFMLVGLDPSESKSMRDAMDRLEAVGPEGELASRDIKGENTNLPASAGRPVPSQETGELFNRNRSIQTQADAQAVLDDLKALSKQIESNLEGLDEVTDVLVQNAILVRATAVSMLSLGDEIKNDTEADRVATLLQQSIRRNAREALSQLDNLEPIAVASLVLDEEKLQNG